MIDVIALAREAGFRTGIYENPAATKFARSISVDCEIELERFAQLVQQATAAECAQLCHERMMEFRYYSGGWSDDDDIKAAGARICADSIRAKFADKDAITGWPPGLMQDDSRKLSKALANTPGARRMVDEQTKAHDAMPKLPS